MKPSKVFPLLILPFKYNGFYGELLGSKPIARGRFLTKTNDPGIVRILLKSGEISLVPTFAIKGPLPKLKWQNCFEKDSASQLFGQSSTLTK